MDDKTKAVKLTTTDLAVVATVQRKLGVRSVAEVLRMGLRALAREQQLEPMYDTQPPKAA